MEERGSKHMVITVETETGRVVKVVDENGNEATRVDAEEIDKIYHSEDGFKYVGTILHAESSPGCAYLVIAGWGFRICR
jgi:hypothetical protein